MAKSTAPAVVEEASGALVATSDVDALMQAQDMGGGKKSAMSLPQVMGRYLKDSKKFDFAVKLGNSEVEVFQTGDIAEFVVLGPPFIEKSLFNPKARGGQGESICRALNGRVSMRSPNPQANSCESCRLNQWVDGAQPPTKHTLSLDGQALRCRDKLLVPMAWIENRGNPDGLVVPCLFTISPTGIKAWRSYFDRFGKAGRFARNQSPFHHQVTAVTLTMQSGSGNFWAVPNFSSVGVYTDTACIVPELAAKIVDYQRQFLQDLQSYAQVVEDADTEDIIPDKPAGRAANEGNPPGVSDEDIPF